MRSEESRLLAFVQERFNTSILAGEPLDGHAALMAAIHDLSVISDERRAALTKSISARVKSRAVHAASIRRRIEKRYGQVLAAFDECIAAAEELNARLVDNFGRGVPGEERGGASVRRYGRELMVGGRRSRFYCLQDCRLGLV